MVNKRRIGNAYEERAVSFLTANGFQVLDRNFYSKYGEIDIIALDSEGFLCFVEVKYRKNHASGDPLEAVTYQKQRKISSAARYYLMTHPRFQRYQIRFDVIGILDDKISHMKNAFEYIGAS